MRSDTARILLVDDHALVRQALADRLSLEDNFTIVGMAGDASEAIDMAVEYQPDIILMDIDMPNLNCFDASSRIISLVKHVNIIFLSAFVYDHYIDSALAVGAKGYLSKSDSIQTVILAIEQVVNGQVYFSEQVKDRLVIDKKPSTRSSNTKTRLSSLSPRELEVLGYIAQGKSTKQVASVMNISAKTVESHTTKLMNKLDLHNRVELTRFAIREQIALP
ncbi:MAG TPA: DNA-binding response regulator [Phycisphaerales bacterium]|nr:DNA-binding response regulator [Phycisphaerales bacterium]|tara:strand:+ start:126 stop:785 length:660 start_codon:yes stop_codon:yes gene_type:complete